MNKMFGDKGITVHNIQQMLCETYNSTVHVTGEYYKTFDMNYGLAHFIAKYLDRKYPILDAATRAEYADVPDDFSQRSLNKPVSIMNYFLCNNRGGKLLFDDETYRKIYNEYMRVKKDASDPNATAYVPEYGGKYMIKNDLPLFTTYDKDSNTYNVKSTIFNLEKWSRNKEICEIDDLVASYLFGQTITPNSSKEEVYYVQKLLIPEEHIAREEKGNWNYVRPNGETLTDTIIQFQQRCMNKYDSVPILVTGYFDIFTENLALSQRETGGGISVTGL